MRTSRGIKKLKIKWRDNDPVQKHLGISDIIPEDIGT